MKNVRILDCTLRDGGRIIDCAFQNQEIKSISERLEKAKIDIVEVGFLRDHRNIEYNGNSTFFTDVDQMRPYVCHGNNNTMFAAFIDFGMCDIDSLKPYDGTSVDALRFGFTKKNYTESKEEVIRWMKIIKERGYKLFVQGVNSLNYSDIELLEIVKMVNEIKPYSFGIVDTYGAMYMDDVDRIYGLINHNMDQDICINFHSHNNYQLSFAFALEIIKLNSSGYRQIIIDGTLSGIGKVAGNLNTELIVEFLVRKKKYNYDVDMIFDIIDEFIHKYSLTHSWGYSIPALMSGIYKAHPNNVIYLTEKYRLDTKDIGKILSMIDPEKRQTYDYGNIQRLYMEYNHTKVDDSADLIRLHELLDGRNVLVVMPGYSIIKYKDLIKKYVIDNECIVISENFISDFADEANRIAFFGSQKRYKNTNNLNYEKNLVIVSNVEKETGEEIVVNYDSLIQRDYEDFDNTTLMLLNLLSKLGIKHFAIAGFDGYKCNETNYFNDEQFDERRFAGKYEEITLNTRNMLNDYAMRLDRKTDVKFLTPSVYQDIFEQ
ncbi:MAG: aldolase catalytic domain-containing protein [Lachnospiraceae bacterium]|nr:aldolase catalytic domain-containing protein [Lachnospiraceae bacterium]